MCWDVAGLTGEGLGVMERAGANWVHCNILGMTRGGLGVLGVVKGDGATGVVLGDRNPSGETWYVHLLQGRRAGWAGRPRAGVSWLAEIGFGKLESGCFGLREDVAARGLGRE